MLRSYPKPPPFVSLPRVATRPLLPIFPPSEQLLVKPALPSPPRQLTLNVPYVLTTHVFPATHLRTSAYVPVPSHPPENATKTERLEICKQLTNKLRDLRVTTDPQGIPQILWNCANRYVRSDLGNRTTSTKGITLFFAHANGFPKEVCSLSSTSQDVQTAILVDMGANTSASPFIICWNHN